MLKSTWLSLAKPKMTLKHTNRLHMSPRYMLT